jgi:hypothetical protein
VRYFSKTKKEVVEKIKKTLKKGKNRDLKPEISSYSGNCI